MKKIILLLMVLLFAESYLKLYGQTIPEITGQVIGEPLEFYSGVLWYQMDSPGTSSITSQNFETVNDIYDSFAADDFGLMDDIWSVTQIDILGAYYNGSGPASSVNVWFYSDSSGLPGQVIYSALNIIPVNGITTGSFSIILPNPVVLFEGMYWFCVQANMDQNPYGQWGWTERTASNFNESAWRNPGGGFGTTCTSWKPRVAECSVGAGPDLCFSLIGDIIPVELASFKASVSSNDVKLIWTTATETNNQGFQIERRKTQDEWNSIGFVNGNGTTTEPQAYSFIDGNIASGKYQYRLKQIDYDGTFEYSNTIEVDVSLPEKFSLEQNYPNPFNPVTTIRYTIPTPPLSSPLAKGRNEVGFVTLKVYDVMGNEIATLVNEEKPAGVYNVQFTMNKLQLSSGIYFYQLKAGDYLETKKMILIK